MYRCFYVYVDKDSAQDSQKQGQGEVHKEHKCHSCSAFMS